VAKSVGDAVHLEMDAVAKMAVAEGARQIKSVTGFKSLMGVATPSALSTILQALSSRVLTINGRTNKLAVEHANLDPNAFNLKRESALLFTVKARATHQTTRWHLPLLQFYKMEGLNKNSRSLIFKTIQRYLKRKSTV